MNRIQYFITMQEIKPHTTLYSFPPVIPGKPLILILGTMPGRESLRLKQYYAFRRNHFWPLMYQLLGKTENPWESSYQKRIEFLSKNQIALWDVYAACIRKKGSLDHSIEQGIPNEILSLLKSNSSIKTIFFNGSTASRGFEIYSESMLLSNPEYNEVMDRISCILLPSSSPIPTKKCRNITEKYQYWLPVMKALTKYLSDLIISD